MLSTATELSLTQMMRFRQQGHLLEDTMTMGCTSEVNKVSSNDRTG